MFEQHHTIFAEVAETCIADLPVVANPAAESAAGPVQPEWRRFELPGNVWVGMIACYAAFFASITLATGGSGRAVFAIVISMLYTAMFFGVARIIARQAGPDGRSPLVRGEALQTWCGPMDGKAVYGQILVVPLAVAAFGVGIAVICAAVL